MLAKAAGGAESLSPAPPTLSVSNLPANGPTSSSGTQESNDGEKQSSHVGAIIGGVIGGLALLAATAVVVWIFLRRRVLARGDGDSNYPDYTKVSTGPPTTENEIPPSHPRLYVGSLASCLARILTNFRRTRLIRQLSTPNRSLHRCSGTVNSRTGLWYPRHSLGDKSPGLAV